MNFIIQRRIKAKRFAANDHSAIASYVVTTASYGDCKASSAINIYIAPKPPITLPDAFSDGVEEGSKFKKNSRGIVSLEYFRIFNR